MKVWLAREGRRVSRKRVQRLMRITALRVRRYDSIWYIPGTIHGVDYDPTDGTDLSSQSAIYPPAWSDLTPPITGEGYSLSKGFCNSPPSWPKSLTFRVTTVSLCTMAVAAIMASSVMVSDLLCMRRAHSRKAGASIGSTP